MTPAVDRVRGACWFQPLRLIRMKSRSLVAPLLGMTCGDSCLAQGNQRVHFRRTPRRQVAG